MGDLHGYSFMVHNRPCCLWATGLREKNHVFLGAVPSGYFSFLADTFNSSATEDTKQLSALALRLAYFQALETLFAFIGAALQAPEFVQGWLHRYREPDIIGITRAISAGQPVQTLLALRENSWKGVARLVFVYVPEAKREPYIDFYSRLWSVLAQEYLNKERKDEYNSIKHGLRIQSRGAYFAIGREEVPGERSPEERMVTLGGSQYGVHHIGTVQLSTKHRHHWLVQDKTAIWQPEALIYSLHFVDYSLKNLVAFLKAVNGVPANEVSFVMPSDVESRLERWRCLLARGVTDWTVGPAVKATDLDLDTLSEEAIRAMHVSRKE